MNSNVQGFMDDFGEVDFSIKEEKPKQTHEGKALLPINDVYRTIGDVLRECFNLPFACQIEGHDSFAGLSRIPHSPHTNLNEVYNKLEMYYDIEMTSGTDFISGTKTRNLVVTRTVDQFIHETLLPSLKQSGKYYISE